MGPRGPRPLARSACNYVWAGEGGRQCSKHTIAIVGRLFSLARSVLPHQSFENRATPLYIVDKSNQQLYCDDGWLLHTICFYGSNERQGISIFAFTDSVGRTDTSIPFNKKSFERGEHARVYESYVCSVLSLSLIRALVCAHFHHGRIRRGTSCDQSGTDRSGVPNQCQYSGRAGLEKPFWRSIAKQIKFSLSCVV